MKVTLNWLKRYVAFDWSPEELTERLTMLGLEVAHDIGAPLQNLVRQPAFVRYLDVGAYRDAIVIDSATTRIAARVWFGGRTPSRQEIVARVEPAGEWRGLALYWAMARAWQRETGLERA